MNRTPDLQGFGLFACAGLADKQTNPDDRNISVGVGDRGIIPETNVDNCGIGYYYSHMQADRLFGIAAIDDHAQGFKADSFVHWRLGRLRTGRPTEHQ